VPAADRSTVPDTDAPTTPLKSGGFCWSAKQDAHPQINSLMRNSLRRSAPLIAVIIVTAGICGSYLLNKPQIDPSVSVPPSNREQLNSTADDSLKQPVEPSRESIQPSPSENNEISDADQDQTIALDDVPESIPIPLRQLRLALQEQLNESVDPIFDQIWLSNAYEVASSWPGSSLVDDSGRPLPNRVRMKGDRTYQFAVLSKENYPDLAELMGAIFDLGEEIALEESTQVHSLGIESK
jgi:hypothetical protein